MIKDQGGGGDGWSGAGECGEGVAAEPDAGARCLEILNANGCVTGGGNGGDGIGATGGVEGELGLRGGGAAADEEGGDGNAGAAGVKVDGWRLKVVGGAADATGAAAGIAEVAGGGDGEGLGGGDGADGEVLGGGEEGAAGLVAGVEGGDVVGGDP